MIMLGHDHQPLGVDVDAKLDERFRNATLLPCLHGLTALLLLMCYGFCCHKKMSLPLSPPYFHVI
jgi:hypothetical protein